MNMDYRDADDIYFDIVKTDGATLFVSIGRTMFQNTYRAMFGFCAKTNSLKTAMFDAVDSNNPYAFKVLFRCFCEHYLRFMYIWSHFVRETSDSIGSEYYSFCGAVEAQDYVSAISMAEALLGNAVVADVKLVLEKLYPEAAKLSKKELEQRSNQFKYRAIIKFLAGEQFGFVGKNRPFLAQIVPAYALLSSFVHGGPYTDIEMAGYSQPMALKECENDAEVVFLMAASVFMCTAAALSREHSQLTFIAAKVNRVIQQFVAEEGGES
jgi:hypothetical protein